MATFAAACIQIATNLFNDAKDFERGGDGPDRIGPLRAAASGQIEVAAIKRAATAIFALAALAACIGVGWRLAHLVARA